MIRILPSPITPLNDEAQYRHIELPNGLRVLLISTCRIASMDPHWTVKFPCSLCNDENEVGSLSSRHHQLPTYLPSNFMGPQCGGGGDDECSARLLGEDPLRQVSIAIAIGSGGYSDPPNLPGLAHFVEHIVHHGTASFEGENSLFEFLHSCDGYGNAFTDRNATVYFGTVAADRKMLLEFCQRYASILLEPIVSLDAVTREVESLDNEYFMRKCSHYFRYQHLVNTTSIPDPDHPMRSFAIGSKEVLMTSEKTNSNSLLTYACQRFIMTHYFAQNMSIVIQGCEDLDYLEDCMVESFGKISKESRLNPEGVRPRGVSLPFHMPSFNRLYSARPSHIDGHTLWLSWIFPPEIWKDYKSKTLNYLAQILGHEAPGGLVYYLRQRGFVISFQVPRLGGSDMNSYVTIFSLRFQLTQRGRDHIDDVLEAVFSYIKLHRSKGPQESIFKEMNSFHLNQMEGMEMDKSMDQIIRIALQLRQCSPEDVLTGDNTPNGVFKANQIQKCLNALNPSRANYFLFTCDTGSDAYMVESVYGTNYIIQELDSDMRRRLENVEVFPEFQLGPPPNPFLQPDLLNPRHDDIIRKRTHFNSSKVSSTCVPCLQMNSRQLRATIIACLGISPILARATRPCFDVMSVLLKMKTLPQLFHQFNAGFRGFVTCSSYNGVVCFQGYGISGPSVVEAIEYMINVFEDFPQKVTEEEFRIAKDAVLDAYFNISANMFCFMQDLSIRLKYGDYLTNVESAKELEKVNFKQFLNFVRLCKGKIHFNCGFEGHIRSNDVRRLVDRLEAFQCQILSKDQIILKMENQSFAKLIPRGERCLRLKAISEGERVSFISNKYQIAQRDEIKDLLTLVIYRLMRVKIGYNLRTLEQLGYVAGVELLVDRNSVGIGIYVLAHIDKHSLCYVDSRIENFLINFFETDLTHENVNTELRNCSCSFVSATMILDFYKKYFLSKEKRKVSIQIMSCREDGKCLCEHKKNDFECKRSEWMDPVQHIGKLNAPVAFGTEFREVSGKKCGTRSSSSQYFITSLEEYHRE